MIKTITIHTRNVSASATIRHVISVNLEARRSVSLSLTIRRGPRGKRGIDGEQGPPGNLENMSNINLSGGFF